MHKWFGIASIALLIAAVVLVTRYDQIHSTEGKGYEVKCVQSNDPTAIAPSLVCTIEHSQKAEDGQYEPAWWHVFLTWPEGITALLLAFTLIGILWQAKATSDAARASLLQAQHTVTSERAWMSIGSGGNDCGSAAGILEFWWTIKNCGKTPARIIETQCIYELVESKSLYDLPDTPQYGMPIDLKRFLIPPGEGKEYSAILKYGGQVVKKEALGNDLKTLLIEKYLRVYGYVKYLDGFGGTKESRFIEYYVAPLPNRSPRSTGFKPLIGAPAAYTECT